MWDHEFEVVVTEEFETIWFSGLKIEDYTICVCKHCGAHKHD